MAAEEPKYDRSRPPPSSTVAFRYELANCPGKTLIGMVVSFPPNASAPPHNHGSASVAAHVLEGKLLNKMNDEPPCVVEAGGSWYEPPGCRHRVFDNHSATETAKTFATLIVDTKVLEENGMGVLVQVDEEYSDIQAAGMMGTQ